MAKPTPPPQRPAPAPPAPAAIPAPAAPAKPALRVEQQVTREPITEPRPAPTPAPPPTAPAPAVGVAPRFFRVLRKCDVPHGTHGMHITLHVGAVLKSTSYDIEALKKMGVPLEEVMDQDAGPRAILR